MQSALCRRAEVKRACVGGELHGVCLNGNSGQGLADDEPVCVWFCADDSRGVICVVVKFTTDDYADGRASKRCITGDD